MVKSMVASISAAISASSRSSAASSASFRVDQRGAGKKGDGVLAAALFLFGGVAIGGLVLRAWAIEAIAIDRQKGRTPGARAIDRRRRAASATTSTSSPSTVSAASPKACARSCRARVGGGLIDARAHAILVVDADENAGQLPQGRHVHAFVKDACPSRHRRKTPPRSPRRICGAARSARRRQWRDAATDDGVAPRSQPHVGNASSRPCHGNSPPFPADLGHHAVGVGAAR